MIFFNKALFSDFDLQHISLDYIHRKHVTRKAHFKNYFDKTFNIFAESEMRKQKQKNNYH